MNIFKTSASIVFVLSLLINPVHAATETEKLTLNQTLAVQETKAVLAQRKIVTREYDQLHKKLTREGKVRIIAKVKRVGVTEDSRGSFSAGIKTLKSFSTLIDAELKREVSRLGFVALEVDAKQLNALLDSGVVEYLEEDKLLKPNLAQSVPWVGANGLWSLGHSGQGHAVAILDTGFDLDHPFLVNRIVEEACFSSINSQSISLCPNGQTQMFGPGSAAECSATYGSTCGHGTHVAGIAAGNDATLFGVAPGANLVVINVFHYNTSVGDVRAWSSDMLAGLDWVLSGAMTPNIVAANMSIGGSVHEEPCDQDIMATTITALKQANIATVIASGNNGSNTGVTWPSCISEAVTVGASFKDSDALESFSNTSPQVDLIAPGGFIFSSFPNDIYVYSWGTSMAAPHVAGAFATLRSAFPAATVNEIETALKTTGVPIVHGTSGLSYPRIDLASAYFALYGGAGTSNIYQAEDQTWFKAKVETEHAGYTGGGYVNTDNVSGSWVEFNVNVASAGNYEITLRYASAGTGSRNTDIIVNGSTAITAHPYASTGAWSTWLETTVEVALTAGSNSIRLLSVTANGAPNLDRMTINALPGSNPAFSATVQAEDALWSAGPVENEHTGFNGSGYVNTPNSTGQWVEFGVNVPHSGTYSLDVRYANGVAVNRSASVVVDDVTVISAVDFTGTGAWSNWMVKTVDFYLTAGYHNIRLNALTTHGAANMDEYTITYIDNQ